MWITAREFKNKYNLSNQLFYYLKKNNKIMFKQQSPKKTLVWDDYNSPKKRDIRSYAMYIRSCDNEPLSVKSQKDVIKKYTDNYDFKEIIQYIDDERTSFDNERPALKKLITDCLEGKIGKIFVFNREVLGSISIKYLECVFKWLDIPVIYIEPLSEKDEIILLQKNLMKILTNSYENK